MEAMLQPLAVHHYQRHSRARPPPRLAFPVVLQCEDTQCGRFSVLPAGFDISGLQTQFFCPLNPHADIGECPRAPGAVVTALSAYHSSLAVSSAPVQPRGAARFHEGDVVMVLYNKTVYPGKVSLDLPADQGMNFPCRAHCV